MSFDDYTGIPAMNWSSLSNMAVSPRLYKWRLDHPRPDSPTLALGRAVHCAILEPGLFEQRYVYPPPGYNARTKLGQEWKAAQSREILTTDQADTISCCVQAVMEHDHARDLLTGTENEVVIEWTDEWSGIACKSRLDAISKWPALVDLKTTRELARFERSIAQYRYHGQLAFYHDGARAAGVLPDEVPTVAIVAVETIEPYDVGVYILDGPTLEAGRSLYRRLLDLYVECDRTDTWPGQCPSPRAVDLPRWADGVDDGEEGF